MPEIPIIKTADFLKLLIKYGCVQVGSKGSHYKIRNPVNGKISVVPVYVGKDLKKGLFAKILSDLEIDVEGFINFIKG